MISTAAPPNSADQIRDLAKDIFSRPEFGGNAQPTWWAIIEKWLIDFFRSLAGLSSTAPVLYWVLVIGLSLLLVVLLAHIIYTVYRTLTFSEGDAASTQRAVRLRRSAEHAAEARSCAEAGDYTEAIRHLFLALIFRFDERGRVTLRPAATNREYLGQLDDRLPIRPELQIFVDFLDDYWYGQRPARLTHFEQCNDLYQQLIVGAG